MYLKFITEKSEARGSRPKNRQRGHCKIPPSLSVSSNPSEVGGTDVNIVIP
jgi:hypothetical protein